MAMKPMADIHRLCVRLASTVVIDVTQSASKYAIEKTVAAFEPTITKLVEALQQTAQEFHSLHKLPPYSLQDFRHCEHNICTTNRSVLTELEKE